MKKFLLVSSALIVILGGCSNQSVSKNLNSSENGLKEQPKKDAQKIHDISSEDKKLLILSKIKNLIMLLKRQEI
ncbi:hypothetical protein ACQKKC_03360 [Bacillus altitudinis]|uniref:hypothetical protein n=1 Tax=Bacillus altitudinis TaxID=293387 RepID=UPI003D07F187